jgi:hypothetical protein
MSRSSQTEEKDVKPKKKICCACPETKVRFALPSFVIPWATFSNSILEPLIKLPSRSHNDACTCRPSQGKRDECIAIHGPESSQCAKLIEAHKACLREEGFRVD